MSSSLSEKTGRSRTRLTLQLLRLRSAVAWSPTRRPPEGGIEGVRDAAHRPVLAPGEQDALASDDAGRGHRGRGGHRDGRRGEGRLHPDAGARLRPGEQHAHPEPGGAPLGRRAPELGIGGAPDALRREGRRGGVLVGAPGGSGGSPFDPAHLREPELADPRDGHDVVLLRRRQPRYSIGAAFGRRGRAERGLIHAGKHRDSH